VTEPEVAQLKRIFDKARSASYTPAQSLQFAVTALLVSPNFLFRVEREPPPDKAAAISDIELASRLAILEFDAG
jgi:hypothetical protein